jgi:hypothetical protein
MKTRQILKMTDRPKEDCRLGNGSSLNMQVLDYVKGMSPFLQIKKSPSSMGVYSPGGEICFGLGQ